MIRMERIYWPALDRMGQKTINWMLDRHDADRVLAWYRDQGFAVMRPEDVWCLPETVVEQRASCLREYWRRWLFGESAAVMLAGPAGLAVGGPFLLMVVFAWSIEMGWAYGHDMTDAVRLDDLRQTVYRSLMRALGLPTRSWPQLTRWRRVMGTILFWGFGPELMAADVVMAEIRSDFRNEWERRRRLVPFTST